MASSSRASPDKQQCLPTSAPTPVIPIDPFEYYDAGNHWCQDCNVTSGSMFDFFMHLHSKSHKKTQDPYSRPWASTSTKDEKKDSSGEKMVKPAKGSEFLLPVRGFYCQMCDAFYGDAICAEEHVTSHAHNEKYKKQLHENPLYEQRRNLDRQAGVGGKKHSELKRKHEDENKDNENEEKSKHSKKDEVKSIHKKEEEQKVEEKAKLSVKEEEEKISYSKREEEKPKSIKKEEEGRSSSSKRDGEDKYKCPKEEPERYRYGKEERYSSRREEEDGYKYRRDEEERSRYGRSDDRYKYSRRDNEEEERSRYSKGKDPKPKYCREYEMDEGRNKPYNKDMVERPKEENPGSKKQPEKSSEKLDELTKVVCGPSLAMKAQLRKKSEEATKGETNAPPPAFGKFSWNKKQNELAKEAERVAAEFRKDEEEKVSEEKDEDPFSASVFMAKSIAVKLANSRHVYRPTNPWSPYQGRGRIRPNLPPPSMVLRKSIGVFSKPTPLNTFLSIRPPSTGGVTPLPAAHIQSPAVSMLPQDIISKAFDGQEVIFKKPDQPPKPVLVSYPANVMPTGANPAPAPIPAPIPAPVPAPVPKRTVQSDVAAPGVPACEQNRAVLVQAPPPMSKYTSETVQKSGKTQSKLNDLFDIFYNSGAPSSTSSASSPAGISKGRANDAKPSDSMQSVTPETKQPQPHLATDPKNGTSAVIQDPKKSEPLPSVAKPAPSAAKPAPSAAKPAPSVAKPAPSAAKPAPSVAKPAPKPAPSVVKPAPRPRAKVVDDFDYDFNFE